MLVNNGKYRRSILVFRKYYNDVESFTGGFPIIESILNSFAEIPSITIEELQLMSDVDYQARLNSFYTYLGLKHPFFNPVEHLPDEADETINNAGEDTDSCPLDYPSASRLYISLEVVYRTDGADKYATVKVTLKNGVGNPVTLPGDYIGTGVIKEVDGIPESDWVNLEGRLESFTILAGQSEAIILPEFQFKGDGVLTSAEVTLLDEDEEDGIEIYPTSRVQISSSEPAYLLNYISNLQQAYQDMISNQIAQEKINSGEGIRILGKKDYIFTFEPDQPKRPVFIYPKSWGKLSEILLVQAQNMNIINDGAFLFNNSEPFEYDLTVDGESSTYYVYASKAMIIYPYRAEYIFKF